jgi:hypothetical protein
MALFTKYVENRDYSVSDVLKLINEESYTHLTLSRGKVISWGSFFDYFGEAMWIACLTATTIYVAPKLANATAKLPYYHAPHIHIHEGGRASNAANIDTLLKEDAINRYFTKKSYSGQEVTFLLNKMHEASTKTEKLAVMNEFATGQYENEKVPVSKDAGWFMGPSAVFDEIQVTDNKDYTYVKSITNVIAGGLGVAVGIGALMYESLAKEGAEKKKLEEQQKKAAEQDYHRYDDAGSYKEYYDEEYYYADQSAPAVSGKHYQAYPSESYNQGSFNHPVGGFYPSAPDLEPDSTYGTVNDTFYYMPAPSAPALGDDNEPGSTYYGVEGVSNLITPPGGLQVEGYSY